MKKNIGVFILGAIFICMGVAVIIYTDELMANCTEEINGTVVDYYRNADSDYYPIVEYRIGDRTLIQQTKTVFRSKVFNIGDKVKILYNPNKVDEFVTITVFSGSKGAICS